MLSVHVWFNRTIYNLEMSLSFWNLTDQIKFSKLDHEYIKPEGSDMVTICSLTKLTELKSLSDKIVWIIFRKWVSFSNWEPQLLGNPYSVHGVSGCLSENITAYPADEIAFIECTSKVDNFLFC